VSNLCELADLKSALSITAASNDRALELAIESASRLIEQHCGRKFTADTAATARTFDPADGFRCQVDDISTTSGLVIRTDENDDGTFETLWSAADYVLEPLNGIVDAQPWPYTRIRAVDSLYFPVATARPSVQVTARWGWPGGVPAPVEQAALIQAAMTYKSIDAPFGVAGFGEIGTMRLTRRLHPTAEILVEPYRIMPLAVG
jgi:hypothetical protein